MIYLYIALAAVALLGAVIWLARWQGRSSAKLAQAEADLKAADVVSDKRSEVAQMTPEERGKAKQKWTKPPSS